MGGGLSEWKGLDGVGGFLGFCLDVLNVFCAGEGVAKRSLDGQRRMIYLYD